MSCTRTNVTLRATAHVGCVRCQINFVIQPLINAQRIGTPDHTLDEISRRVPRLLPSSARPHSTAQMEHKIMHMCEPHDRPSPSQRQLGSLPAGAFAAAAIAAAAAASAVAATAPSRRSRLAARRLTAGLVRHRIRLSSPPPRAASSRCKLDRHCRGTSFVCGRRQAGRRAGRQVRLTSERRSRARYNQRGR